ncbi:hypothetical protein TWF173_007587 [Orbilia oligospora]|nr:hypothetical protein TWF173_007587 [Orbilia oligospora]
MDPILSPACRVGFYHTNENVFKRERPSNITWEGYPLGKKPWPIANFTKQMEYEQQFTEDQNCRKIEPSFGEAIAHAGIEFAWSLGYCGCGFFFLGNCTGDFSFLPPERITSINPYKLDIRNNNNGGSELGMFQSFYCIADSGWRPPFICKLSFSNGGNQKSQYNSFDGVGRTLAISKGFMDAGSGSDLKLGPSAIDGSTGQGSCISVSSELPGIEGIIMRQWEIENCTCIFWTTDKCEGKPYLIDGVRGLVSRENVERVFGRVQKVRSFRCDAPYGPSFH